MPKLSPFSLLAGAVLLTASCTDPDTGSKRVYESEGSDYLTAPSDAPFSSIIGGFLRSRGAHEGSISALKLIGEHRSSRTGFVHVKLEQEVRGLKVVNAYAKAALTERGELVHLIDEL